jgi:hypothetical protein
LTGSCWAAIIQLTDAVIVLRPGAESHDVSWFLGTIAFFLDELDFTTLVPPPIEPKPPVFVAEPPSAPLDPSPPQCSQAPAASSPSAAPPNPCQLAASPARAAKPGRQSRLWNAGGPAALAALERRDAEERQALLHHAPREAAAERSAPAWATPEENVIRLRLDD